MLTVIGLFLCAIVFTMILSFAHYIFYLIITKDLTDEEIEEYNESIGNGNTNYKNNSNGNWFDSN